MKVRDELLKRIEKKEIEIREIEKQLAAAGAYLQALQDLLKLLPKEAGGQVTEPQQVLRPGSAVAKAREAILSAGKPLHITDLLKALGRELDKANRVSLAGSLSGYVKRGEIFTRPAPNTFGLVELTQNNVNAEGSRQGATAGTSQVSGGGGDDDDNGLFELDHSG